MTERPNIVLLISHDTGRFISPYGVDTVHTPNFERLAEESVLFENAFCTAPQCSPSRAALVTGRYPHANGVMGLTHADYAWGLHSTEQPVAKLLSTAGYETWMLGLPHETRDAQVLGFDHVEWGLLLGERSSLTWRRIRTSSRTSLRIQRMPSCVRSRGPVW